MKNPKPLIQSLGGIKKTAKVSEVSIQAVYAWIRAGQIPKGRALVLRLRRPEQFKAWTEAPEPDNAPMPTENDPADPTPAAAQ